MPIDVSIIIVNYNSEECLFECIESIKRHVSKVDYEIIIVDNNSPGKYKLNDLNFKESNLKLIETGNNGGFGFGCNVGAKNANGELLLFLNPDTEFIDESLERLIAAYRLGRDNGVGAVSPVFTDRKGRPIYSYNSFPNFKWELAEALGLGGTGKITSEHIRIMESKLNSNEDFKVDAFTGACILISRNLFFETGGFDEKMFLYYEDTDLQKRLSVKGLKNVIISGCKIVHTPNTSTKSVNGEMFYYYNLYRSKLIYFKKHLSFYKRFFFRSMHIAGIFLRLSCVPIRKKFKNKRKEYSAFYIKMLYMLFSYRP